MDWFLSRVVEIHIQDRPKGEELKDELELVYPVCLLRASSLVWDSVFCSLMFIIKQCLCYYSFQVVWQRLHAQNFTVKQNKHRNKQNQQHKKLSCLTTRKQKRMKSGNHSAWCYV